MKFLHLSDFHFDAANADRALASLAVAEETGRREEIDFFALAGDLFHRGIINSSAARLPDLLAAIGRMLDVAPIFAVSGTPTHDVAGCYAPLQEIGMRRYLFTLLGPGEHFRLATDEEDYLIMGLPEPSKTWLLAGSNGLSAEEANGRVKVELRNVLLGLGAARAEHPEIPAVMLYHGAIDGATLANGQLLEGGIAIGREDLALVGADYYALGHVHMRQQIPGLPAWYAGSAFPVTWGETDQKGCNLVEIEAREGQCGFFTGWTFVPFPHPPRRKIEVTWGDDITPHLPLTGQQVWLAVKAPKEHCGQEDLAILEGKLAIHGPADGSRVTLEAIPTETVRAAEITSRKHLREKVLVYAEASDELPPAESVLAKADTLEADAGQAAAEAGSHLRIRKLRLRGATGIWKGLGVDEITLDLDTYDAGLVALIGPNGAGKSTLIESMHPWPCMLTREGKLQDHFRLRDSARELWFVDERDGQEYRALMLIDGVNATGKAEYHLFAGDTPLTNGRREDYEAAIERLFGSLALFLRSAFVSQRATKNNPDLAEATKGEKKAIFRELAGLDYLQVAAEDAKARAGAIEAETARAEAAVGARLEALASLPDLRAKVEKTAAELAGREQELQGIEAKGKDLAAAAGELAKAVEQQKATERRISEALETAKTAGAEASKARTEIGSLSAALAGKGEAEHSLAEYDRLREEEAQENARAKEHAELVARTESQYSDALRAHRKHEAEVGKRHTETQTAMVRMEGDRRVVLTQIDRLIADIGTPEKACPNCGYVDPARLELRETWQKTLEAAQEKAHGLAQDIEEKRRALEAIEAESTEPPAKPSVPAFDGARMRALRAAVDAVDVAKIRATLDRAQTATVRIAELKQIEQGSRAQADHATALAEGLREQLDGTLDSRAAKAQAAVDEARKEYVAASQVCAALRSQLDLHRQRIAELEQQQAEIEIQRQAIACRKTEAAEWAYLHKACGPDGIQALELDALGPSIAEVANRLLASSYGPRFSIEFSTTRIAGRGSSVRQIEDFQIHITDNENGSQQEISTLSGGESIWIKNALYMAFGVIRERNTGMKLLTAFIDEMDGALDPDSRMKYFAMLQVAHHESGRRNTIVITHSEAAQEAIPQKIIMRDFAEVRDVA